MRRTREDGKVVCDTFADVIVGERVMWLAHERKRKPDTFVKVSDELTKDDDGHLRTVMVPSRTEPLLVGCRGAMIEHEEHDPAEDIETGAFDLADESACAVEIAVEAVDERAAACNVDVSRAEILCEIVAHATKLHAEAMGIDLADYLLDLAGKAVRPK